MVSGTAGSRTTSDAIRAQLLHLLALSTAA